MKPMYAPARREAAFTAIEITAVATIIAILALLIIPLLRGRVDAAKLVAAQDDLNTIVKAETFCNADTGHYARIHDLDNTKEYDTADLTRDLDKRVPHHFWNKRLTAAERDAFARVWDGPYFAAPRNVPLTDFINATAGNPAALGQRPELFRGPGGLQGPIPISADEVDNFPTAAQNELIPIDPWGNPYMFFSSGKVEEPDAEGANGAIIPVANQTDFSNAVAYCIGPDGLPGNGQSPTVVQNWFRETGVLGESASDDMAIYF